MPFDNSPSYEPDIDSEPPRALGGPCENPECKGDGIASRHLPGMDGGHVVCKTCHDEWENAD